MATKLHDRPDREEIAKEIRAQRPWLDDASLAECVNVYLEWLKKNDLPAGPVYPN